jgi:hypothetical protein
VRRRHGWASSEGRASSEPHVPGTMISQYSASSECRAAAHTHRLNLMSQMEAPTDDMMDVSFARPPCNPIPKSVTSPCRPSLPQSRPPAAHPSLSHAPLPPIPPSVMPPCRPSLPQSCPPAAHPSLSHAPLPPIHPSVMSPSRPSIPLSRPLATPVRGERRRVGERERRSGRRCERARAKYREGGRRGGQGGREGGTA